MGLNFSIRTPVEFPEWWIGWLNDAPCKEDLELVAAILWVIWCSRNQAVFQNVQVSLHEELSQLKGVQKSNAGFQE